MRNRYDVASVMSSVVMDFFFKYTQFSQHYIAIKSATVITTVISKDCPVRKIKHCTGNIKYLYNGLNQN